MAQTDDRIVYVERKDGVIISVYSWFHENIAEEEVLADDPEVLSFFDAQKSE